MRITSAGVKGDNSAMEAFGKVDIIGGTTGSFYLYISSDEGFRLRLNGVVIAEFVGVTGGSNMTVQVTVNDGDVFQLTYFQQSADSFIRFRTTDQFDSNHDGGSFVGNTASGIDVLPLSFPPPSHTAPGQQWAAA